MLDDALNALPAALAEPVRAALAEFDWPAERPLPAGLARAWALSDFVRQGCLRAPELLRELADEGALERDRAREDYRRPALALAEGCAGDEAAMMSGLRRLRQKEMLRIAWRDLVGQASLEQTLFETSWLAEACLQAAEQWSRALLVARHGEPRDAEGRPQRLVVLGMGKLGGEELNFSSDIDLIFAYPEPGRTDGARALDNQQFFTRQGQVLIRLLNERTADGFVFRVDMRLRPFGDSGPLVQHFEAMETYYLEHGREWERYALVKARAVAGDPEAGAALLARLEPFVYRRYLDYHTFHELRALKAKIDREARRRGREDDLKLGPGGIREVEFIVQAFQILRGGREARLRRRRLLEVLPELARLGLLPETETQRLEAAYRFLRLAENHVQMLRDEQRHDLPPPGPDRLRLALAQGLDDEAALLAELDALRSFVRARFEAIFGEPGAGEAPGDDTARALLDGELEPDEIRHWLQGLGLGQADADAVLERLRLLGASRALRALGQHGRAHLLRLLPLLVTAAAEQAQPADTLLRLLDLVEAVAGRSTYLALLADHPQALAVLALLFSASPWIATMVTRHPLLLDELIDPRRIHHPPDREAMREVLERLFEGVDEDDTETVMERLRQFRHGIVFRIAAADLVGALPVMQVSDHLTWVAELVLEKALAVVWGQMTRRHGVPCYRADGERRRAEVGIIGYGKLGGLEMGYGSDLDIVFLHDSHGSRQQTDGERPLENAVFFARLVQRIVTLLTTATPSGVLYEVDMRLRPSGSSGLLVSSLEAFARYQREEAWTWEHQALVRARPVAGGERVAERFGEIRREVLARPRDVATLQQEVRTLRERMWCQHGWRKPGRFDLKRDPGGITDIEFVVQYAVLAHARRHPALLRWTDNVRLLGELAATGVLAAEDAGRLAAIYREFRDHLHHRHLAGQGADVDPARFSDQRAFVQGVWQQVMGAAPLRGRDQCNNPGED